VADTKTDAEGRITPRLTVLYQHYPNKPNPSASIEFCSPEHVGRLSCCASVCYNRAMFTTAIVRPPGPDFERGITTSSLGPPDYEKALGQHAAYCDALTSCGLELISLEPDPNFPDCPFVEDTAVVTAEIAVIARPGDPRRRGEEADIAGVLAGYRRLEQIESPGTLDGGDVLDAGNRFFIGLSGRTNEEGARQLTAILESIGHTVSIVPAGPMLHLKSAVNYAGGALAVARQLARADCFAEYERIAVPDEESYAANCLYVNGRLIMAAGFPRTKELLGGLGHEIIELEMSEFMKMDGGLTCLSIRF
jgi:dimethylargininase